ncbi:hypothetical protein [Neisseria musculi]|uniref:Uncharacterized protein n=1 Tax=Neisseria musculi TaxID=1815583 RepID=A0A7H1M7Z6_9NEIS|nr:hypothetical protein [Neisseria musculi]QNT57761.1 hypothetical protein H7A79_2702 [Neisseria musculi]
MNEKNRGSIKTPVAVKAIVKECLIKIKVIYIYFLCAAEFGGHTGRLKNGGQQGRRLFGQNSSRLPQAGSGIENTCADKVKYLKLRVYEIKF